MPLWLRVNGNDMCKYRAIGPPFRTPLIVCINNSHLQIVSGTNNRHQQWLAHTKYINN